MVEIITPLLQSGFTNICQTQFYNTQPRKDITLNAETCRKNYSAWVMKTAASDRIKCNYSKGYCDAKLAKNLYFRLPRFAHVNIPENPLVRLSVHIHFPAHWQKRFD